MHDTHQHPDAATEALTRATVLLTYAEMNSAAHQIAALLAREVPHGAFLDLEHSDQGDWLATHSLHGASGDLICQTSNLTALLLGTLETYACHLYTGHLACLPGTLDSPVADVRLDLPLTLAHSQQLARDTLQHVTLEVVAIPQHFC